MGWGHLRILSVGDKPSGVKALRDSCPSVTYMNPETFARYIPSIPILNSPEVPKPQAQAKYQVTIIQKSFCSKYIQKIVCSY